MPVSVLITSLAVAAAVATTSAGGMQNPDESWSEPTGDAPVTPNDGSDDAGTVSDDANPTSEDATEPPATAVESPPAPSATPPASADDQVPTKRGIGLLVGAGAAGLFGVGMSAWRVQITKKGCRDDSLDGDAVLTEDEANALVGTGLGCIDAKLRAIPAWLLQATGNGASWGLAAGGGILMARFDAARFARDGAPDRNGIALLATGASIAALGFGARITFAAIRWRNPHVTKCAGDANSDTTVDEFYDCYNRRSTLFIIGHQASAMVAGAGVGLLSYGATYHVRRRKQATPVSWRLTPQFGADYNGLSAELRW